MLSVTEFRRQRTTEQRTQDASRIRSKYPDRIPVICCCDPKSSSLPDIDRQKFLTPATITVGEMVYILRKRMRLDPAKALFVFTEDGTLPTTSSSMSDVYAAHKHHDGFLYSCTPRRTRLARLTKRGSTEARGP